MKLLLIPHYKVDESLSFTCAVFGWLLVDDHITYKTNKRSARNITVSQLLYEIKNLNICCGITDIIVPEMVLHCIHLSSTLIKIWTNVNKHTNLKGPKTVSCSLKQLEHVRHALISKNYVKVKRNEKSNEWMNHHAWMLHF